MPDMRSQHAERIMPDTMRPKVGDRSKRRLLQLLGRLFDGYVCVLTEP